MPTPRKAVATLFVPYIFYRDIDAALAWLTKAFGFVETLKHATPSGGIHAEMQLDGQMIMMGQGARDPQLLSALEAGVGTQGVFVWIADVDAHYERAVAAGATIVQPLLDQPYGRSYYARDLDGHPWFFTTPWEDAP
jgi:PhnB protein